MRFQPSSLLIAALLCVLTSAGHAQLARKPSSYEAGKLEPESLIARPSTSPAQTMGDKKLVAELPAITSRKEFDQLARVYNTGTPLEQPHVIFVIERRANAAARLSFINTPRFQLHDRFLRETGRFRGSSEEFNRNYEVANRRFILGTLSWQPQISGYVFEFWEGDKLTPELLRITADKVGSQFFTKVQFKANSSAQEQVARDANIPVITQAELIGQQTFLPLNMRRGVGRLRIVESIEKLADLQRTDIVVLREVPINLAPVAGIITAQPSTMISHVNLLAKGWGIPNAFVKDAAQVLAAMDGQWVTLDVRANDYELRPATDEERKAAQQRAAQAKPEAVVTITADLKSTQLKPLSALRVGHRTQCGAKAAHLGEVLAARIANTVVPDGFCIPFGVYARAMSEFGLQQRVERMTQQPGFDSNTNVRREALAQLRREIENMPLNAAVTKDWQQRWSTQLKSEGVFVRSSSSSEDLPNFSGAGLYSTVPNVRNADTLNNAVRHVWASVFNLEAWDARNAAGIPNDAVVMAVLVQQAVNSQASGVMITRSPLGSTPYTTFIAAKRGLGIRVVDGQRVAEQVLYSSWSKAIQVISQSAEDSSLQLDPNGGVREVPIKPGERNVLSDARVKKLADAGSAIERRFGGKAQDIEWALTDDQRVIVLQARPYVTAPANR